MNDGRHHAPRDPYLAARQEWNERYGSYVKAAASWRIVGVTGMLMAVIGFSYALYQSTQVKLVPYIVEVDRLGTAATVGFPQQIEYADPRVVRATLGSFVSNFRSVTPDAVVQKQYIDLLCAAAQRRSLDPEGQCLVPGQFALRSRPHAHRRHRGEPHQSLSNQSYQVDSSTSATGLGRNSPNAASAASPRSR